MLKEEVLKIRTLLENTKHTKKDGTVISLPYRVMLDNEHGFDTSRNPIIWDDTNEFLYAFGYNSHTFQPGVAGHEKAPRPGMVTAADYSMIQRFEASLSEEDFDAYCDQLGTTLIPDNVRENIRIWLFRATDPSWNIKNNMSNIDKGSY